MTIGLFEVFKFKFFFQGAINDHGLGLVSWWTSMAETCEDEDEEGTSSQEQQA